MSVCLICTPRIPWTSVVYVCEWNEGKRMRGGERSGEKITSDIYASELYCVCAHKTKVSM